MANDTKVITALDGVTATTTSNAIYVGGAKRIGVLVRRADNAGGTSTFAIKASLEPADTVTPTMTALNLWIDNVTNAITQNLTRVNGTAIANANGDKFLFLDPCACINWIEITVTEISDGTHSAFVLLEY